MITATSNPVLGEVPANCARQARGQVLSFFGKIHFRGATFLLLLCFNKKFLGTKKFGGHCPRMPPPVVMGVGAPQSFKIVMLPKQTYTVICKKTGRHDTPDVYVMFASATSPE